MGDSTKLEPPPAKHRDEKFKPAVVDIGEVAVCGCMRICPQIRGRAKRSRYSIVIFDTTSLLWMEVHCTRRTIPRVPAGLQTTFAIP
jgi:hypothetical protein